MTQIIITRADEVEKTLEARPDIVAVVSIEHPGVKPDEHGYAPRVKKVPQNIVAIWDTEHPGDDAPPIVLVAEALIFAVQHAKKGPVLIHCQAGKSRSAAIALGVLAALHPERDGATLAEDLLKIRPIAGPNIIMVEILDRLLGRGGELVEAVLTHPTISANRQRNDEGRQAWIERRKKKQPPGPS